MEARKGYYDGLGGALGRYLREVAEIDQKIEELDLRQMKSEKVQIPFKEAMKRAMRKEGTS
jgi:hypothetical protein